MIVNNHKGLLLMRHDYLHERDWRSDDSYKLIFSPYGDTDYQTNQGDITIKHNEFLILNPKTDHKQLKATKEKFLIELQPTLIKDTAEQLGIKMIEPEFSLLTLKHNLVSRWTSFIRDFLTSNQDIQPGSNQLFLENSLAQISILILQHGAGSHQNHLSTVGGGDIINDVLQALKQSYQHEWTLDDMAKIARMGKYQFAHLFKEEVGRSPYSWLQLYRLFRSQEPLLKTNHSILSIALEHGFSSVSSYNQLFKKVYGKTPTHFRSLHRYP